MPASTLPFVSVVVPARNAEVLIQACLESLASLEYPKDRHEVLVVDNGSSDRTLDIARRYPVRAVNEPRRGISYARNRGIEAGRGEVVAFTDVDCVVSTCWLTELVKPLDDDGVGGVAGEIVPYPGATSAERYAARRRSHSQERPTKHPARPFAMTPNVAFRRTVFARVGVFDTRFPGGGWEDADLCWRVARCTDLKLAYAPKAVVFHRYRSTARAFFVQHLRYGYGLALLSAKYRGELSPDWRRGVTAYGELGRAVWTLLTTMAIAKRRAAPLALETAYFDVLRQAGQRAGFLRGKLTGSVTPGFRREGAA